MIKLQIPEGSTIFFGLINALRRIVGMYSCEMEILVGVEPDGAPSRVEKDTAKASIMAISREVAVAKIVLDRDGVPRLHKARLTPVGRDAYQFVTDVRPCFAAYAAGKTVVVSGTKASPKPDKGLVEKKKKVVEPGKPTKAKGRRSKTKDPSEEGLLAASVFADRVVREGTLDTLSRIAANGTFTLDEVVKAQGFLSEDLRECSRDSLRLYLERVLVVDGSVKIVSADNYRLTDAASDNDESEEDRYWRKFESRVMKAIKPEVPDNLTTPIQAPVTMPEPEPAPAEPAKAPEPEPAPGPEVSFDLEPEAERPPAKEVVDEAVHTAEVQFAAVEEPASPMAEVQPPPAVKPLELPVYATKELSPNAAELLLLLLRSRADKGTMVFERGFVFLIRGFLSPALKVEKPNAISQAICELRDKGYVAKKANREERTLRLLPKAVGVIEPTLPLASTKPTEPARAKYEARAPVPVLDKDTAEVLVLMVCVARGGTIINAEHLLALWRYASPELKAKGGKVVADSVAKLDKLHCVKRLTGQRILLSPDAFILAKKLAQEELAK